MSTLNCLHCGAQSNTGTVLCNRCKATGKVALENVAAYHVDLLSLGRERVQVPRRSGGFSDPTGLAVSRVEPKGDAGDLAAADTKAHLVGYARMLLDERPQLKQPDDTVASLSQFLVRHLRSIATLEWAGALVAETLRLEDRLRRLIERSKGQWYAGICSAELSPERPHDGTTCLCACHDSEDTPCDIDGGCRPEVEVIEAEHCQHDLYATPGATYVRCPECKAGWLLHERRHIMLEASREVLLPLYEIARVVVSLSDDEPSTQRLLARLNKRVQRGDLKHRQVKVQGGRPVKHYRLGDVTDTLTLRDAKTAG